MNHYTNTYISKLYMFMIFTLCTHLIITSCFKFNPSTSNNLFKNTKYNTINTFEKNINNQNIYTNNLNTIKYTNKPNQSANLNTVTKTVLIEDLDYTLTVESNLHENEIEENTGHLTKRRGVFEGPSGRETWYNLSMNGVVKLMRSKGFSEEEYPYWVREDGVKMFGDYIMVAANLETRPKGTIIETSLGTAIVCDTGEFVEEYPDGIDIAVDW